MKRFERTNGLDTALYKHCLYLSRLFTVTGNDVSSTQRHQLIKLVSLYTEANNSDNDITVDDTDRVLEEVRGHGMYGRSFPFKECHINHQDVVQERLQQGSCCTCARPVMFLSSHNNNKNTNKK